MKLKQDKHYIQDVISKLKKEYPVNKTALNSSNPFELLVAVILSAQCTDARVNVVTQRLFKKYRSVKDYATADLKEFEQDIFSTGFYKNKAKNIIKTANIILNYFNGKVPETMVDLLKLAGVGRKTANVLLNHAFNKVEGIVVDTHVTRLSNRLGWTKQLDAVKIEAELMNLIEKDEWGRIATLLIFHGRAVCKARKPNCADCVLNHICPSAFNVKF